MKIYKAELIKFQKKIKLYKLNQIKLKIRTKIR